MAPKPSREDVLAYVDATGCAAVEAAAHFGDRLSPNQVRAWLSRRRKSVAKPPATTPGAPEPARNAASQRGNAPPRPRGTPARDLPPDERQRAVRIVTDARFVTEHRLARLRKKLEDGEDVEIDAREAQALLNLQRTAEVVLATHPGLLELTRDGVDGPGAAGGGDVAERLRRALDTVRPGDED